LSSIHPHGLGDKWAVWDMQCRLAISVNWPLCHFIQWRFAKCKLRCSLRETYSAERLSFCTESMHRCLIIDIVLGKHWHIGHYYLLVSVRFCFVMK